MMMITRSSETRLCSTRVAPCDCAMDGTSIHGFTLRDGVRDGFYVAELRSTGDVHWIDLAVSAGAGQGTIALRVWLETSTQFVRTRVLAPNDVDVHPALTLGGWLNKVEVSALDVEIHELTTRIVLGDDRLSAHLWDVNASFSPTALAAPIRR